MHQVLRVRAGRHHRSCDIRDHWGEFEDLGVEVVGISPDDHHSHAAFAARHQLPHTLLADTDRKVLDKYGAWGEKNMYGKKSMGIQRSTFLIGPDGKVIKVWKKVSVDGHDDQVIAALAELAAE